MEDIKPLLPVIEEYRAVGLDHALSKIKSRTGTIIDKALLSGELTVRKVNIYFILRIQKSSRFWRLLLTI